MSLKKGGKEYKTDFFQYHESFSMIFIRNDIALIRLVEDIEFNELVQPIPLPTHNFHQVNYPATLTGWGLTKVSTPKKKKKKLSLQKKKQNY